MNLDCNNNERSNDKEIKLRVNSFRVNVENRNLFFYNMCPINSLIHSFMHIHTSMQNLNQVAESNHEFFQLIVSLFEISFEEGNRRIANFIISKELYLSISENEVNCEAHIELIVDKIQMPISANLYCHNCHMNKDFS